MDKVELDQIVKQANLQINLALKEVKLSEQTEEFMVNYTVNIINKVIDSFIEFIKIRYTLGELVEEVAYHPTQKELLEVIQIFTQRLTIEEVNSDAQETTDSTKYN